MATSESDTTISVEKRGYSPPPVPQVERPKLPVPPRRPVSDSGPRPQNGESNG